MDSIYQLLSRNLTVDQALTASTAAIGLGTTVLSWIVLRFLGKATTAETIYGLFEPARRLQVRGRSFLYRNLEPLVDWLAEWYRQKSPARVEAVGKHLTLAAEKVPWKPEEYMAIKQIEGAFIGLGAAIIGYLLSDSILIAIGAWVLVGLCYPVQTRSALAKRAQNRLQVLKTRLPFGIDLLAIMMEAGATFQESLAKVVEENQNHPLGQECGEVLREVNLGRPRSEALLGLQQRVNDQDVSEFVYAVVKGEELGTPLSQILRSQADQMRLKRSQWAEKASGEAQVNIVFSGMIIMIACLLIVLAPFLLSALSGNL